MSGPLGSVPAPAHSWPTDSVGYLVWRAHLVFRRALDEGLAELDVTMAQVGLAAELMERGPRAVADLARVIGLTPQGAAFAIAHLRELGWVAESAAKGRGRTILLEITELGREGYLKAARVVEQVDVTMTAGVTEAERAAAIAALRVIAQAGPTPPPRPADRHGQ
jgi:DNA-binding MarR family transcriptional regulator